MRDQILNLGLGESIFRKGMVGQVGGQMQEMWAVLPLPSLSSYPLSLAIHCLYWPSSWRSKEGKGGARPGSRDHVVGVRKESVQPALYLEATHPAGTGQLPPGSRVTSAHSSS